MVQGWGFMGGGALTILGVVGMCSAEGCFLVNFPQLGVPFD